MYKDNTEMKNGQEGKVRFKSAIIKKLESQRWRVAALASIYSYLGLADRAFKVLSCGTKVAIGTLYKSGNVSEDSSEPQLIETFEKLLHSWFCRDRLCPMCADRRSRKIFGQVSEILDYLANLKYCFLFLTLTVRNVKAQDVYRRDDFTNGHILSGQIDRMMKAFKEFSRRPAFKRAFHGWFRALECTYNDEEQSYHLHYHMILAVKPSYFWKNSKTYLDQPVLQNMWAECWGNVSGDYEALVDIRKIRPDENGNLHKAVSEVAKYTVKSSDWEKEHRIEFQAEIVKTYATALSGRLLVTFGGVFRDARRALLHDDPVDGDLDDPKPMRDDVLFMVEHHNWGIGANPFLTYGKEYEVVAVQSGEEYTATVEAEKNLAKDFKAGLDFSRKAWDAYLKEYGQPQDDPVFKAEIKEMRRMEAEARASGDAGGVSFLERQRLKAEAINLERKREIVHKNLRRKNE